MSGDLGLLRVGYQQAVIIGKWSLTCKQDALGLPAASITAIIRSVDDFWINQEPKTIGLFMGNSWWTWNRVKLSAPICEGSTVELSVEGNPTAVDKF